MWGAGGTSFALAAVYAVYPGADHSAWELVKFALIAVVVGLIWFGLIARLAVGALLSAATSYAGVLGRLFIKYRFGKKLLAWSEV